MNRLLPYFQLVRLPNIFTAWADIFLAALAMGALPAAAGPFLMLLAASSLLYCSGMVWNDYFDFEKDERERPFRPLPSRRIPISTAFLLGIGLMMLGVFFAVLADMCRGPYRPYATVIAVLIAAAIFAYDGWLKRTWAGPIAMGICRFLNVLLGLAVVGWQHWGLLLALVVGVYIAGVTWFARNEARKSQRIWLAAASAVMLLAAVIALTLPAVGPPLRDPESNLPLSRHVFWGQLLFPYLLVGFLLFIGIPIYRALRRPIPDTVQAAVKRTIFGLVLLDAVLATAFAGPLALLLLLLLIPAQFLGRWVYST